MESEVTCIICHYPFNQKYIKIKWQNNHNMWFNCADG